MTQDLYYIEEGYYDIGYYVYTADAEAVITSTTSISCDASVVAGGEIVIASGDFPGFATMTVTISHIEGADLFAFSQAAIAVAVDRIRDNNVSASSAFAIATDASRTRNYSSEDSADFQVSIANLRVRFNEAAIDAAFSLDAVGSIDLGGETIQASGAWSSSFASESTAVKIHQSAVTVSASLSLSTSGVVTRDASSSIDSSSSIALTPSRIIQGQISAGALFSPSFDINAVKNTFAVLESISGMSVAITDMTKESAVSVASSTNLTSSATRTRGLVSNLSSQATLSSLAGRIQSATITCGALFSPSVTADSVKNSFAILDSVASLTASSNKTAQAQSSITASSSLSATVVRLPFYWHKEFDIPATPTVYVNDLIVDSAQNITAVGSYVSDQNAFITQWDKLGNVLWTKTLTTGSSESFRTIKTDSSGNFYVSGNGTLAGTPCGILAKYNTSGTLLWQRTLDSSIAGGRAQFLDMDVSSAGNIYLVGDITTGAGIRGLVAKYDTNGTFGWARYVNGITTFKNIVLDSLEWLYVSWNSGNTVGLYKIANTGNSIVASPTFTGSGANQTGATITGLTIDSSDFIYFSYTNYSSVAGETRNSITKISLGLADVSWTRSYTFSDLDIITDLDWSDNYLYMIVGNNKSIQGQINPANGDIIWSKKYLSGSGYNYNLYPTAIFVRSGTIYVGGNDYNSPPTLLKGTISKFAINGSGIPNSGSYTNYTITPVTYTISRSTFSQVTAQAGTTVATGTLTDGTATISIDYTAEFSSVGINKTLDSTTISSAASLTATGARTKRATASLSSQAAVSAQPDFGLKNFTASLSSNGFVVAANGRIRPQVADLSSAFTFNVNAGNQIIGNATIESVSNLTATSNRIKLAVVSIDSQATLSAQLNFGIKNLTASLESNGFVVAASGRIRPQIAALDSQFVLTTSAVKLKSTTASLSSQFALTAQVLDLDLAQANLTAAFSLSAEANKQKGGSASLQSAFAFNVAEDFTALRLYADPTSPYTTSGYIVSTGGPISRNISSAGYEGFHSLWVNFNFRTGQWTDPNSIFIYIGGQLSQAETTSPFTYANARPWILFSKTSTGWTLQVKNTLVHTPPNNLGVPGADGLYNVRQTTFRYTLTLPASFDPTQWHNVHIPMVQGYHMEANPAGAYPNLFSSGPFENPRIDGVEYPFVVTSSVTTLARGGYTTPSMVVDAEGGNWGAYNNDIELWLSRIWINSNGTGTNEYEFTSFPVTEFYGPTSRIGATGITAGSYVPDVWLPLNRSSQLLDKSPVEPTWNYTAVNKVAIGITKDYTANLTSAFTQFTRPYRIVQGGASITTSAFTATTNNRRVRYSQAAVAATISITIRGQRNAILQSTPNVVSSVTANLVRTQRTGSAMSSQVTMSAVAKKTVNVQSATSSITQLTSGQQVTRTVTSQQSSQFTANVSAVKTTTTASTIQAFGSELVAINKIGRGLIGMDARVTMTVSGKITADQPQYMFSQTQMSATGFNIQYGSASITARATTSIQSTYLRRNEAALIARATLTLVPKRTRNNILSTGAQFNQFTYTANSKITRYSATMASQAQMVTRNQIVRLAQAQMSAVTEQRSIVGSVTRFQANLQAFDFVLFEGRIIHIDEYLQLLIEAESRGLIITQETRLLGVDSENRVNKIIGR